MVERSEGQVYNCPVCGGKGTMRFVSGDVEVIWHACSICASRLITLKNINATKEVVKLGTKEVLCDNDKVAKLLKNSEKRRAL